MANNKDPKTPPSDEEVAAAQELIRRHAEAQRQQNEEQVKPILDLVQDKAFQTTLEKLFEIPNEFLAHNSIGPQLMAARQGMRGLTQVVSGFAPSVNEAAAG